MLDVCAAVIQREGALLLATRPPGSHLAGKWEFPGGKVHPDESREDCICREIAEELGLRLTSARLLDTVEYAYPDKTLRLHFLECAVADGPCVPRCHDGQRVGWFTPVEASRLDLAPADRVFLERRWNTCAHTPGK